MLGVGSIRNKLVGLKLICPLGMTISSIWIYSGINKNNGIFQVIENFRTV